MVVIRERLYAHPVYLFSNAVSILSYWGFGTLECDAF